MGVQEMLQPLAERLGAGASVKNVYGEPITAEGKTVVPVAKVRYGFGGGMGKGRGKEEEGGGAGGGMQAVPLGVVEITSQATRFVPVDISRKLTCAVLAGFGLGYLYARKRCT